MGNTKQYGTLVSAGEVIEKTFTNKNTDPVLVSENTIVLSELAHLRPLLGEKFYAELKLQHDTGTLTAANQTFMTYYLEDTLCWYVRFEVVNDIMSNITSSGVMDFLKGADQAGLYPTFNSNKPKSLSNTYKNHGMIFYDSIYGYNGIEGCMSCGTSYVNGNECNCGCTDC